MGDFSLEDGQLKHVCFRIDLGKCMEHFVNGITFARFHYSTMLIISLQTCVNLLQSLAESVVFPGLLASDLVALLSCDILRLSSWVVADTAGLDDFRIRELDVVLAISTLVDSDDNADQAFMSSSRRR